VTRDFGIFFLGYAMGGATFIGLMIKFLLERL
jgi:hypothetical protein